MLEDARKGSRQAAPVRLDRAAPARRHDRRARPGPAVPPLRGTGHDVGPPVPHEGQHRARLGRAGLLFSVLITAIVTVAIKDAVGRPRPDFFWRCFPDGVPKYNNVTGDVICHGKPGVIKEGYKSFPSGHASGAFAGLGFLSWYLAGKLKAFDRRGHVAKLCIVLLPLLLATMVAISRVTDYWHHWQDVFAGGVLGLVVASFCYLQFFPPPYSEHGVWPHAYLEHIRGPEGELQAQSTTNSNMHHNSLPLDLSGSNETRTTSHALDSIEEGSRDQ
uniref:Lipid phosphate phosphatase 2 n=1 Tax=Aegilops tauschii TaxID=37682 RepID=R7W032_AEGTA